MGSSGNAEYMGFYLNKYFFKENFML